MGFPIGKDTRLELPRNEEGVIAIHKPVGLTSHRMAMDLSKRLGTVVSHTGSLDPMAEGVMIFLVGDKAVRHQREWQAMNKEYLFEVLLGFSTDTYDLLGLVTKTKNHVGKIRLEPFRSKIESRVKRWKGEVEQERPAYSYKKIKGKALYWWARKGRLGEIEIPKVRVRIHRSQLISIRSETTAILVSEISRKIGMVRGDFRQKAILDRWTKVLGKCLHQRWLVVTIQASCSKGTYIRSLAKKLGEDIEIPSLAYHIVRIRNGPYRLKDCIKNPYE